MIMSTSLSQYSVSCNARCKPIYVRYNSKCRFVLRKTIKKQKNMYLFKWTDSYMFSYSNSLFSNSIFHGLTGIPVIQNKIPDSHDTDNIHAPDYGNRLPSAAHT